MPKNSNNQILERLNVQFNELVEDFQNNSKSLTVSSYFKYFIHLLAISSKLKNLKNDVNSTNRIKIINEKLKIISDFEEQVFFKHQFYKNTQILNNKILVLFKSADTTIDDLDNILKKYNGRYHLGLLGEVLIDAIMKALATSKKSNLLNKKCNRSTENYQALIATSEYEILKVLFKYNLKIIGFHKYQQTIMKRALLIGDLKLIKLLIIKGISVHLKIDSTGSSIISWAMQFKNIALINLLINLEAEINIANNNGETPLHFAVLIGDVEFLKEILKIKKLILSPIDKNGLSPIGWLASFNNSKLKIEIIKAFLSIKTLEVIKEDEKLEFPNKKIKAELKQLLFLEITNNKDIIIIDFLLNQAININEFYKGLTIITHALKTFNSKIKLIKQKQINESAQKRIIKTETTKLLLILEMLIKANANINLQDNFKNLPILEAIKSDKIKILELLIKKGAKLNYIDENNNNLLHIAIMQKSKKAAIMLLNLKISSKAVNACNKSTYDLAIENNMVELILRMAAKSINKKFRF